MGTGRLHISNLGKAVLNPRAFFLALLPVVLMTVPLKAQAVNFERVLAEAKKEAELNLWSNTPEGAVMPQLIEAFNKRFGMKIKVNQVPMGTRDFTTRVIAGFQAGRPEADQGQGAWDTVSILNEKGLLEEFDWVGVFGQEFPDIRKRVQRVIPDFRGKVLDYSHLASVIVYRTDRLREGDVPRTWEGLADPKWRGQIALNQEGSPFHYLAPFWGPEKVLELARKLKANQPLFARGARGAGTLVESGEATIGVTTVEVPEYGRSKGVPVDWVAPSEIPIAVEHLIILKRAPHPNLARLWAVWITTESRPLFEKLTWKGLAWPDEDSFLSRRLKAFGTKFRFAETKEQNNTMMEVRKQIEHLYLGK